MKNITIKKEDTNNANTDEKSGRYRNGDSF